MPKVNKTKYAILGVLSLGPGSGYDIKKFCDCSITHFWSENYGHIYPVLKQLESEGLIKKTTEYTEGKPPRNIYELKEEGRKEFLEWLKMPVEKPHVRYEFLLKMFFSEDIPLEEVLDRLKQTKKIAEDLLQEYSKIEEWIKEKETKEKRNGTPFWLATVRYGIRDARSRIEWIEETINNFTDLKEKPIRKGE